MRARFRNAALESVRLRDCHPHRDRKPRLLIIFPLLVFEFQDRSVKGRIRRGEQSEESLQRRRFAVAAFDLQHHPLNVAVVLVGLQELQTLLRIAPLQDLDQLLSRAP